jgi:hypothetical protein
MAKKNHHLVRRGDAWYLVATVGGRRLKKALSSSVTKARRLRDEYLEQVRITGDIQKPEPAKPCPLFGEVAQKWAKVKEKKVKSSTLKDYRSAMNIYVLPRFGNVPIDKISYGDVEVFISELKCSAKRINNILVIPLSPNSILNFAPAL